MCGRWSEWTALASSLQEAAPLKPSGGRGANVIDSAASEPLSGTDSCSQSSSDAADTAGDGPHDLTAVIQQLRGFLENTPDRRPPRLLPQAEMSTPPVEPCNADSAKLKAALARNVLLSSLAHDHLDELLSASSQVPFREGEVLIDTRLRRRGTLFLILDGSIAVIFAEGAEGQTAGEEQGWLVQGVGALFGSTPAGLDVDCYVRGEAGAEWQGQPLHMLNTLKAWGKTAGIVQCFHRRAVTTVLVPLLRARRKRIADALASSSLLAQLPRAALSRLADCAREERWAKLDVVNGSPSTPRNDVNQSQEGGVRSGQVLRDLLVLQQGAVWKTVPAKDLAGGGELLKSGVGHVRVRLLMAGTVCLAAALSRQPRCL